MNTINSDIALTCLQNQSSEALKTIGGIVTAKMVDLGVTPNARAFRRPVKGGGGQAVSSVIRVIETLGVEVSKLEDGKIKSQRVAKEAGFLQSLDSFITKRQSLSA